MPTPNLQQTKLQLIATSQYYLEQFSLQIGPAVKYRYAETIDRKRNVQNMWTWIYIVANAWSKTYNDFEMELEKNQYCILCIEERKSLLREFVKSASCLRKQHEKEFFENTFKISH